MLRHFSKLPLGLVTKSSIQRQYYVRFYKTTAYYRDKTKQKDVIEKEKCPDDSSGRGFYYTLGAIILGSGAVVAYAKHDPEFRAWLNDNIPGSDGFIAFITAEETSHIDYLVKYLAHLKQYVWSGLMDLFSHDDKSSSDKPKSLGPCDSKGEPYIPPPSPFKPLAEEEVAKQPAAIPKDMVNITDEEEEMEKPKIELIEDMKIKPEELMPKNLVQLEGAINRAAKAAIDAYTSAVCVLREHAEYIYTLVEQSIEKVNPKIWDDIKTKTEERERIVKEAEKNAKEAVARVDTLKNYLDDPKLPGGADVRERATKNLEKILTDIKDAKKVYEKERARVAITDKYWNKVREARKHFAEELEILFPNVRITEHKINLDEGEIDLFVLYAFQNILFYQKELSKLDTLMNHKLQEALTDLKLKTDEDITEACVEQEVEKVKRKYALEFQKRMLVLRAECERNIRKQLKLQAQAHADHLADAMAMKEKEMERKMRREMEDRLMEEKNKFKEELAAMVGRLRGMDDMMKKRANQDKITQQSQILWSACQSLEAALRAPNNCNKPLEETMRPLQHEVAAISKAASSGDELVKVIIKALPPEVSSRGVYNDNALRERFINVERVAKRVALLPEGGASLPLMFLSYLQSLFIITPTNPIPSYELCNEPFEPGKFNTFDILQRARYWIDRGDFYQALRYMNLLQGAPKVVAREWVRETRIYLETLQAARALMAHASAAGVAYS